jgi:hypothetical protein
MLWRCWASSEHEIAGAGNTSRAARASFPLRYCIRRTPAQRTAAAAPSAMGGPGRTAAVGYMVGRALGHPVASGTATICMDCAPLKPRRRGAKLPRYGGSCAGRLARWLKPLGSTEATCSRMDTQGENRHVTSDYRDRPRADFFNEQQQVRPHSGSGGRHIHAGHVVPIQLSKVEFRLCRQAPWAYSRQRGAGLVGHLGSAGYWKSFGSSLNVGAENSAQHMPEDPDRIAHDRKWKTSVKRAKWHYSLVLWRR